VKCSFRVALTALEPKCEINVSARLCLEVKERHKFCFRDMCVLRASSLVAEKSIHKLRKADEVEIFLEKRSVQRPPGNCQGHFILGM
jgi:hypothetical protein